jgi:hypothetical protein
VVIPIILFLFLSYVSCIRAHFIYFIELLRRSAEDTLVTLTKTLFERLNLVMGLKISRKDISSNGLLSSLSSACVGVCVDAAQKNRGWNLEFSRVDERGLSWSPFGLPVTLELIRVLVTVLDPKNRNHTEKSHRVVALRLLSTALDCGGAGLGVWLGWGDFIVGRRLEGKDDVDFELEDPEELEMSVAVRELVVKELIKYLFQVCFLLLLFYNIDVCG